MKTKALISTLLSLAITSSAFGSCYENYQEKREQLEKTIEDSNYKRALTEGIMISVSTNIAVMAALSATAAGGPLPSTIGGLGLISGALIGEKYLNLRTDQSAKDAFQTQVILNATLALLKEAYVGYGPHLSQALSVFHQNISTSISMKDLAETIVAQDKELSYCLDNQIMSATGILELAAEELRQRF